MGKILLKKVSYLENDFYKILDFKDDFLISDEYDDFNNVLNSDKDLFYYEIDDKNDLKELVGRILGNNGNEIFLVPDDLESEINDYLEMEEEYQNMDNKEIKDIVDILSSKYPFQKQTIINLLKKIYENQGIKDLDINEKIKRKLIKSILYIGTYGCNKESILDDMASLIKIPCANINISLKDSENVNNIMDALLLKTTSDEEASKGIVFIKIKENVDDVIKDFFSNASFSENIIELYLSLVNFLNRKGIIEKNGRKIDFRTLTFVITLDVMEQMKIDKDDIINLMNLSGAQVFIMGNEMSIYQKIYYLMSENGPIMEYAKYFEAKNKKLKYDPDAIAYLVNYYHNLGYSIKVIESVLENIMDYLISANHKSPSITLSLVKKVIEELGEDNLEKEIENDDNPKEELSLKNVYSKVLESVVGQDKQVKEILYNILQNRRMANMDGLDNPKEYIKNILLRGESGGGKTFIISTIAKLLNIPMFVADATSYTEAGYVGNDVTDMLKDLYFAADSNLEEAEKGILVIDEIDKKAGMGSNSDVTRGAVLNSLLKIVEGTVIPINVGSSPYPEEIMFDTSRLTVIISGAFEGIEKIRDQRVKKESVGTIGFTTGGVKKEIDKNIIDKDYVEFGMIKQFMARFPVIVNLSKNNQESLKNIMLYSKSSPLKIEAFKLNTLGVKVEYTDDFYDELAKISLSMDIGARGNDKALQYVLSKIHIEDFDYSNIEKIIFNKECIYNPDALIVIPKTKGKVKRKTL